MRINIDRLCELAGVPGSQRSRGGLIRESAYDNSLYEKSGMDPALAAALDEQDGFDHGSEIPDALGADLDEANNDNDIVEVDEKDLVNELRRMKVKMYEQRKIQKRRQQNLQEAQLKAVIDQEVKNVLKELNLNSGWMYGKNKPKRSSHGYTHQGSFLKGFGFK